VRVPNSVYIDSPAWPLVQAHISYWGITSANGNAFGTTVVDAALATEPSYIGLVVKIISGGAAGQVRPIMGMAAGTVTVAPAFTDGGGAVEQIVAGTQYVILSVGGGGAPAPALAPSIGLWMFGECDPAMVASTTDLLLTNLAGFPEDIFNQEFWIQVIHNFDVPGTAPEREIRRVTNYVGATGTFTTDAFSVNVEANDLVAVIHESIMGIEILGFGTLDTSSTTVPADSTRAAAYAWENNDFFKGAMLMPTEGACRFQPRPVRGYVAATGVFTLDEPFSQAPGAVDYVIIRSDYPVQRLLDIFTLVNAMLVTTETGGTLATTVAAAQDLYINAAPAGVYELLVLKFDLSNMAAGDTVLIDVLYQIRPGAAIPVLEDRVTYVGIQAPLSLKSIDLDPNRYGVQVILNHTIGATFDVDWEVIYRS